MAKLKQDTFSFAANPKGLPREVQERASQKLANAAKGAQASDFVRWLIDAHRTIRKAPPNPEPLDDVTLAAKLMIERIGLDEAKRRAVFFLKGGEGRISLRYFCLKGYKDEKQIDSRFALRKREERIASINSELGTCSFRSTEEKIIGRMGGAPCERSKSYTLGELESVATQLLARYGTDAAIPEGVKRKIRESRK